MSVFNIYCWYIFTDVLFKLWLYNDTQKMTRYSYWYWHFSTWRIWNKYVWFSVEESEWLVRFSCIYFYFNKVVFLIVILARKFYILACSKYFFRKCNFSLCTVNLHINRLLIGSIHKWVNIFLVDWLVHNL